jgi:hypothetical protein
VQVETPLELADLTLESEHNNLRNEIKETVLDPGLGFSDLAIV